MDMSFGNWFSYMGTGDEAMSSHSNGDDHGYNNNYFGHATDLSFNPMSSNNNGYFEPVEHESYNLTAKEVKPESDMLHNNISGWGSCCSSTSPTTAAGQFISFGSSGQLPFGPNYSTNIDNVHEPNGYGLEFPVDNGDDDEHRGKYIELTNNLTSHQRQRNKRVGAMSVCSQEHVLAERKRREIMTQRFLALSALIPGLNKTDKASILGDAARYLKQLEERVKLLEEQTTQRRVECVVLRRNPNSNPNPNHTSSCSYEEEGTNNPTNYPTLLEVEARASSNNVVLIRIHSLVKGKDQSGLVQKVLNEIERLHLTTLNCNTMPFGGFAINITITAQMNDGIFMTVKDLVVNLKLALQQFLCSSQ